MAPTPTPKPGANHRHSDIQGTGNRAGIGTNSARGEIPRRSQLWADRAESTQSNLSLASSSETIKNTLSDNGKTSTPNSTSLPGENVAVGFTNSVTRSVSETSVLLPSRSTLRLRPRRRVKSDDSIASPDSAAGVRNTAGSSSPGSAPLAISSGPGGTGGPRSAAHHSPGGSITRATSAGLLPRNGGPLLGIRAKYTPGRRNGHVAPEVQAANILALASASTVANPKTLEEIDAEAAATARADGHRTRTVRFADEQEARGALASARQMHPPEAPPSPSPPRPSPRRRLSLPSFQQPNGLHCPGRDEIRASRRASDPGLPALRDIMRRRLFPGAAESSSPPTDVDRPEDSEDQGGADNKGGTHHAALEDTQDAIMIATRRRSRLRRSPQVDPVLEVDESRDTMPRWALDFDNFINGLEDVDDDDAVEEEEDKTDCFPEINESAAQ